MLRRYDNALGRVSQRNRRAAGRGREDPIRAFEVKVSARRINDVLVSAPRAALLIKIRSVFECSALVLVVVYPKLRVVLTEKIGNTLERSNRLFPAEIEPGTRRLSQLSRKCTASPLRIRAPVTGSLTRSD
jgi:hypothetical protein